MKKTTLAVNVDSIACTFGVNFRFIVLGGTGTDVDIYPSDLELGREHVRNKLLKALHDENIEPDYDMIDFYVNKIPQTETTNG